MNRRIHIAFLSAALAAGLGTLAASGCDISSTGCVTATKAIEDQLTSACASAPYDKTPFCECCVPARYFAIDDTCTCKDLIFDADFCWYDDGDAGSPAIAKALEYAAGVCQGRQVSVPNGDMQGRQECAGALGQGGAAGGASSSGTGGGASGGG